MKIPKLDRDNEREINAHQSDRLWLWESLFREDRQSLILEDQYGNRILSVYNITPEQLSKLHEEIGIILGKAIAGSSRACRASRTRTCTTNTPARSNRPASKRPKSCNCQALTKRPGQRRSLRPDAQRSRPALGKRYRRACSLGRIGERRGR